MTTRMLFCAFLAFALSICGCKEDSVAPAPAPSKADVVINDVPYRTESFLRIPITLRMWEYQKDGLVLKKIEALNDATKAVLVTLDADNMPRIWKDPLPASPGFTWDKLTSYYMSLQIPIPLSDPVPARISHRFTLRDTVNNADVVVEAAVFSPRVNETPIVIASPVKGSRWLFMNQSTNDYHFFEMFFVDGNLWRGERLAFDNLKLDAAYRETYAGDPGKNESYFNYRDTLYAVADGVVYAAAVDQPERNGDKHDTQMTTPISYAGNYMILNMGNNRYAFYAHMVPHSLRVTVGQTVHKGDPIGLIGNSGNSDAPHLHFQICDRPDFFYSIGLPFVFEKWSKIGVYEGTPTAPVQYTNCNMEQTTVLSFE